jgi:hypothetical protein
MALAGEREWAGVPGVSRAFRPRRYGDSQMLAGISLRVLRGVHGMESLPEPQTADVDGTRSPFRPRAHTKGCPSRAAQARGRLRTARRPTATMQEPKAVAFRGCVVTSRHN